MVTCYPVAGKAKSHNICAAFAEGCGGQIAVGWPELHDGPAFFYGVDASNQGIWNAARARGDYFYCDNSYFDGTARGEYFRITRNRLQHSGEGRSNLERLMGLELAFKVVHGKGEHIVICPQSDAFMHDVVGYRGDWLGDTVAELKELTDRPLVIRLWNRDKAKAQATLADDLAGAHALVTWSSAAAITAALSGVPPFVGGDCPARAVGNDDLCYIETPRLATGDDRMQWAGVLADNQWTLAEMREGVAWGALRP